MYVGGNPDQNDEEEEEDVKVNKEPGITNEEQVMIDQTNDLNKIYCFGDNLKFLIFNVGQMSWTNQVFDATASYDGTLKYMAACATPFSETAAY